MSPIPLERLQHQLKRIGRLTRQLQMAGQKPLQKPDGTVVTAVDYLVQSALTSTLLQLGIRPSLLAEESTDDSALMDEVCTYVSHHLKNLQIETDFESLMGYASHEIPGRDYWILDPIDGTRGFVNGAHYAIALAHLTDGKIDRAYLVCPTLSHSSYPGVLLASDAFEVQVLSLDPSCEPPSPLPALREPRSLAVLIESVTLGPRTERMSQALKKELNWATKTIRMDSQAKYGALVLGQAHCYLRIPRTQDAKEYVWDHAAGAHLVAAAGGTVTDLHGDQLDFSKGAQLAANYGVLATRGVDHTRVLRSVRRQLERLD